MPQVLCTLPNASAEISGVKFTEHAKGTLSEDVTDEQAAGFAAIPGYSIVGAKVPAAEAAAADDVRAALLARAEAAGLKVKASWGNDRLTTEVEAAEKAKAAADEAAAKKAADDAPAADAPAAE
jgi:hypothetical protein